MTKATNSPNNQPNDVAELVNKLNAITETFAYAELDIEGKITEVNLLFLQLLNYKTKRELLNKDYSSFILSSDTYENSFDVVFDNLLNGESSTVVFKHKTKNNDATWLNCTMLPIYNDADEVQKILILALDFNKEKELEESSLQITEELRAQEEELKQNMEEILATQEEMARQSERNSQILQQAVDAIITIDPNKNVTLYNKAAQEMFGYSPEEVMGQNVKMLVPMEHRGNHDNYVDSNVKTGVNKVIGSSRDLEMTRKDGSKFWGNLSLSKVQLEEGVQYTAFIKDVTVQKNFILEQEKLQSELETRMNQINVACLVSESDLKGNITFVNDKLCEVTGYTREECMGQPHNMFRHADSPKEIFKEMWSTIGKGNIFRGVIKNRKKDGNPYWVDAIIAPVMGPNGKPVKYIGVRYDITEQILKEEELKQTMEEIRVTQELVEAQSRQNMQVLEQALDAVVSIDTNKNITLYNKAAQQMFGYSPEEVMGKNVKMLVPMEHRANHDNYVDSNVNTSVNKVVGSSRDLEMTRKDGSKFWGNLSLSKVETENGVLYTAFIKDISAAKNNELAFEQVIKGINMITAGDFNFDINVSGLMIDNNVMQVTENVSTLRDNLKNILDEVNTVVQKAGLQGDLNARLNLNNSQGSWKVLINSLNELLQSIAEPILEFNSIVSSMSKGDLTKRFEMQAKGDIASMAASLNTAIDTLNELLSTIDESANIVADSSNEMLEKSDNMKGNTAEVASAIAQMSKGAQDQAIKTDESSKLVEDVLKSANVMAEKANVINNAANRGQNSCENGLKIVKNLVTNMIEISESASSTSGSIDVLTKRAEEIARTLNVITDIAAQTNLLALNAAIEAARAGDAGRGFAVVAEEIRKLAEDSRKSAIEIEKIISDVQKDTQAASKAIDNMGVIVKQGNSASKEAETIFGEIAESSAETFNFSKEIQEASKVQRDSIDTVVKNIEQIVVVAEETAAGSEQVASSAQQLNNSMNDIARSSGNLSQIAAELQAGVNQFQLKRRK